MPAMPPFHGNIAFNAHHSPMGAYFTFTCGHFNTPAGLAAQSGRPANQDIYIGIKTGNRLAKSPLKCLPFFTNADKTPPAADYLGEQAATAAEPPPIAAYAKSDITRHYAWATDRWTTPDFQFAIYTPFGEIPEPQTATPDQLKSALLPAITAELFVDNPQGKETKTALFALNFDRGLRLLDQLPPHRTGFAWRNQLGFAAQAIDHDNPNSPLRPFPFMRWDPASALADPHNPIHLLGSCPGFAMEVPPGKSYSLRIALGCYLQGNVTTGLKGPYLYTKFYKDLPEVLSTALDHFGALSTKSKSLDQQLLTSNLNPDQQFLLAHATRSYYGNSQLLSIDTKPFWIVNEGEYCMMNTLDLSLDHLFWELHHNPWVLKNLLDNFTKHYSYRDQLGISFTHDMGANNQFSPTGYSAYELSDLTGCFSYMTAEQLCNWTLIAASYLAKTEDLTWGKAHLPLFDEILESFIKRGPTTGLIELDSSRCASGAEITTYDSLDHSLAQTRNNLYMAVKVWAAYEGLKLIFEKLGKPAGAQAGEMQTRIIRRLVEAKQADGSLPAVLEKDNPGYQSRILPAIEGLVYPLLWNRTDRIPPELLGLLKGHTVALLADLQRRNHFPDGGIKLSSTSNNSWASKIALTQYIARRLFGLDETGAPRSSAAGASGWERSDAAHMVWQTQPESAYWAASDQIIAGTAKGSKYYPRLVTAILFLDESQQK